MKIGIINSQKKVKVDITDIKQNAKGALAALDENDAELSVYIVDDSEIRRLNCHYRGVDKATDVLAFSMRQGVSLKGDESILGDVVISAQTAYKCGRGCMKKIKDEINMYLVHGILHLVGYDDNTVSARKKMEKIQNKILKSVCCAVKR